MKKKSIGLIIKDLRAEKRIKQKDVAIAIGVTSAAISDYEVGKSNPSEEKLELLAKYFNVPIETFDVREKTSTLLTNQALSREPESRINQMNEEWRATVEKMEAFYEKQVLFLQEALKEAQEQLKSKDRFIEDLVGKPQVSRSTPLEGENLGAIAA